jgi:hypothetical protein
VHAWIALFAQLAGTSVPPVAYPAKGAAFAPVISCKIKNLPGRMAKAYTEKAVCAASARQLALLRFAADLHVSFLQHKINF